MLLNSKIIKKKKFISFLFCKKSLINFYLKNNWIVFDKKKILNKKTRQYNLLLFNKKILSNYNFVLDELTIKFF